MTKSRPVSAQDVSPCGMKISEMVAAVQKATGVGRKTARQLVSDGAERLDYACDCGDEYTDRDVVDWAIECWRERNQKS